MADVDFVKFSREYAEEGLRLIAAGLPGATPHHLPRAAQVAIVAQAEAAHRQADALERLATAAEKIAGHLDSVVLQSGLAVVIRP